ncbi:MAG: phenylalanine--tRNA ligase subunit alpha [Promethearchaeota archaeon]
MSELRLQEHEIRVLKLLSDGKRRTASEISGELGLDHIAVIRATSRLGNGGMLEIEDEKKVIPRLTKEGKEVLKKGLPEKNLVLEIGNRKVEIKKISLEDKEIAIGWSRKKQLIDMDEINGRIFLSVTKHGKEYLSRESPEEILLNKVGRGVPVDKKELENLRRRKFVTLDYKTVRWAEINKKGLELADRIEYVEEVSQITPELLASGGWKNVKLRKYNVMAPVVERNPGKRHPLRMLEDEIRRVWTELGFAEMKGPMIESEFWNFDLLFMPQGHPSRELMETLFSKNPRKTKLPKKELVERVRQIHENGGNTGSDGWQYKWLKDVARRAIFRTHTTATSYRYLARIRYLAKDFDLPAKFFCIDRVFRNEAIDKTHLPEFNQIEGFVIAEKLNLKNHLGALKQFYEKMGIAEIRFKPTYNPYTEPSAEIFGYHPSLKRWVEIGNSGMFRPETLIPLDLNDVQVLAWGLALERLAMILFEITDIRQLLGHTVDMDWLRRFPVYPRILR